MTKGLFDFSGLTKLTTGFDPVRVGKGAVRVGRAMRANSVYAEVAAEFGHETAEAVAAAIRAGRNPKPILERATRLKREHEEREALLKAPPPLHGSARWAQPADLARVLCSAKWDNPRSIFLGHVGNSSIQWDDQGHLMTLAPTRSGKSVTTIIHNLLHYRGSCVVLDPKGELYEKTSKWRRSIGDVYRIAPFDEGFDPATAHFPRHGYNPLLHIRTQAAARSLAEMMFPRDPRAQEFFIEDALSFLTALILFLILEAPENRCNIGTLRALTAAPINEFQTHVGLMAKSRYQPISDAANNVLGKNATHGLPNLRDTLNSKLSLWSDPAVMAATDRNDIDFKKLKEGTATVYITVPFHLIKPYAPFLKVLLRAALDAMLENPKVPDIPVLFILDEFLALGSFPEFRDAIRTHAGAGVRLWFFLQDLGTLREFYPGTGWEAFFNCSVKQFFGTDDPFTGELIGKILGNQTLAYRSTSASANVSAQMGGDGGSAGLNFSTSENITFLGKALLNPDEVMRELSAWLPDGSRNGIVQLRDPAYPIRARLVPYQRDGICRDREGALQI